MPTHDNGNDQPEHLGRFHMVGDVNRRLHSERPLAGSMSEIAIFHQLSDSSAD